MLFVGIRDHDCKDDFPKEDVHIIRDLAKRVADIASDPINEVRAAYEILRALKLRERGIELISCPTCGRCDLDIIGLTHEIEEQLLRVKTPLKVAIMGCVVNGPGEAREADVENVLYISRYALFRCQRS